MTLCEWQGDKHDSQQLCDTSFTWFMIDMIDMKCTSTTVVQLVTMLKSRRLRCQVEGGPVPCPAVQPTVDASRHIETHQDINSLRFRISMCFVIYFVSFISFISLSWFMMNCKIDHHIPMDHSRSLMLTYIHHVFHKKTSCRYFLNHVLKAEPSLNQRAQCFSGPG